MTDTHDMEDLMTEVGKSVAIGLLPFVGQAIDIYDTAYAAYDIYNSQDAKGEQRDEAYFNMAMAAIGWIPGPGDGIKKTLKTINKNPQKYAPLLLDAVRQALYSAGYKVDPYQFLMDSIDAGRIRAIINGAKSDIAGSSIYQRCPAMVQTSMMAGMGMASQSVPMMVGVVERKVKTWLKLTPRNTAVTHQIDSKAKSPPPKQQGSKGEAGTQGAINPTTANTEGSNTTEIAMANINQKQESVGEHIADFYCHDHLMWGANKGSTAKHDKHDKTSAKLTDGYHLNQLSTDIKARGVGIDAIWKTGTTPSYAVTEYKTRSMFMSANAIKNLLVSEAAQEVSQKTQYRKASKQHRKIQKIGPPPTAHPAKPDSDVPKMSHKWIQDRVEMKIDLNGSDKRALEIKSNYSRHVIHVVTSSGAGKIHREELEAAFNASPRRQVDENKHTEHTNDVHNYMNVFTEYKKDVEQADPQGTSQPQGKSTGRTKKPRR